MQTVDLPAVIQTVASFAFSLIVLLLPLVIKLLYPQVAAWLDAKAKDAQWGVVVKVAYAVVAQVEQMRKVGLLPDNKAALGWASTQLRNLLLLRGIDLPTDNLVTAIEKAVNELPHSEPAPAPKA